MRPSSPGRESGESLTRKAEAACVRSSLSSRIHGGQRAPQFALLHEPRPGKNDAVAFHAWIVGELSIARNGEIAARRPEFMQSHGRDQACGWIVLLTIEDTHQRNDAAIPAVFRCNLPEPMERQRTVDLQVRDIAFQ